MQGLFGYWRLLFQPTIIKNYFKHPSWIYTAKCIKT